MATVTAPPTSPDRPDHLAEAQELASAAGPVEEGTPVHLPPSRPGTRLTQSLEFVRDPLAYNLGSRARYGDVWEAKLLSREEPFVVTAHPDHVRSLLTAKPEDAPSLTGESPLRPILGPNSVLTSIGARHMRQRKLLLPPFHGEAVQRYVEMITQVAEREIDRWQAGDAFALAPRMQAVTLDVIMTGVFGIPLDPTPGTDDFRLKQTFRRLMNAGSHPAFAVVDLLNSSRREPKGILKWVLAAADRRLYAVIRKRRAENDTERTDVLSLLLQARDEEGEPLTDHELRDELMSLILAGHETTANSLAWTYERLLRTPAAYDRLREVVRGEDQEAAEAYVEATIQEGMRMRPVIGMIVRGVKRPWRFGEFVVPAGTPVAMSIAAIHHREDVYERPFSFEPERFLGVKAGTYTWFPFGGGIRRCLGASLAMAEQRVVLSAIARRTDLRAPNLAPEAPRQRNVTMIPARGGQVVVERTRPA
jgi:cytochrome P450